jgi:hypothetical protein
MIRLARCSLGAVALAASVAGAQGTLSGQGFGYPGAGLSTRAGAAGGALGEFDFSSARNPSSVLGWGRGGMYFQYEPEFRSISAPGGSDRTTTARFPMTMGALQTGGRTMLAFSSTMLLDRTWATRVRSGQILGTDSVGFEETTSSAGAINDLRMALAYSVTGALSVGAAIHGYTGENRMQLIRQFDDSLKYGTLLRGLTLGYSGTALSIGATWRPHRTIAVAASLRQGGGMTLHVADSVVSTAHVPNRVGAAIRFDGLPGASLAVSVDHTKWTRMASLSGTGLGVRDATEVGVGAELLGPRMRGFPSIFYLGYRRRDLPFSTTGDDVQERLVSAGAGVPIAGPRATLDFAFQRASRGSVREVREGAWLFSVGFTVRP